MNRRDKLALLVVPCRFGVKCYCEVRIRPFKLP